MKKKSISIFLLEPKYCNYNLYQIFRNILKFKTFTIPVLSSDKLYKLVLKVRFWVI